VNARLSWNPIDEWSHIESAERPYTLNIHSTKDFNLGAISMTLRLPEGVAVEHVAALSADSQEPVIYKQEGDILRLAWYHLADWNVRKGDAILRLTLKGKGAGVIEIEESSSELATGNAIPVLGMPIAAPRLDPKAAKPTAISVYPNPSSADATLQFGLDASATVQVKVMDAIGKVVLEKLSNTLEIGNHQMHLPLKELAQGTYYLIVLKHYDNGTSSKEVVRIQRSR
jgi:hypothetical protein